MATIKEDIKEIKDNIKETNRDVNKLKISVEKMFNLMDGVKDTVKVHEKKIMEDCPITVDTIKTEIIKLQKEDIKFGFKQQIIWALILFILITASNLMVSFVLKNPFSFIKI